MLALYYLRLIKSSLFRSAGIYMMTNISNALIPFLLLPVLTRYLSPKDYGIIAMFSMGATIVGALVGLSIHGAIGRQYFDDDRINLPRYITNCLYILVVSSIIVGAIFAVFSMPISRLIAVPRCWLWAVWVVAVGNVVILVNLSLWQVQVKPFLYGSFQIILTTINVGLSILFIVFLNMKFQGRILAQAISVGLFGCLSILVLIRSGWFQHGYRKEHVTDALKFGIPLIPHIIGGMAIVMTDRFLVAHMVGIADVGVYTVGVQIGMAIGLIEDSFTQAWVPWVFDKLSVNDPAQKVKIVKFTYCYNIFLILLALLLALVTPVLFKFFLGKDFFGAGVYVIWVALGYAFSGMYKMVANIIFFVKKTYILAWVTFMTAVINVFLSYYLIKLNGAIGAAQGTMLAFFFSYILTWILSAKIYKMPWMLRMN